MESKEVVDLFIAAYKDKLSKDNLEKISSEYRSLLIADADARRAKTKECIVQMAKLKIELEKFENTYSKIKNCFGGIDVVDRYIQQIQMMIKKLSLEKNKSFKLQND